MQRRGRAHLRQGTSSAAANPAASTLNLRNFGYTRTLILFDGHRLAPTAPDGTVDTNMVPSMLLKRVDVVTGGASAVYGSDAVTGVVNFVSDATEQIPSCPVLPTENTSV
jgi:iron complex outermembrane recepter protein